MIEKNSKLLYNTRGDAKNEARKHQKLFNYCPY